jgi:uncharacterized protein YdeI (YjbR/CyaY-like superfamily)
MAMDSLERVEVRSRPELRAWLAANFEQPASIWLVTYKKLVPEFYVSYDAVVEEALCFGWIDSRTGRVDERRSMLLLAPRKRGSSWSRANKERVERLAAAGSITPAGWAKIEAAKADGSWDALNEVDALIVPPDLAAALQQADALAAFEKLAPSLRRGLLDQLRQAKTPVTRAKRIGLLVERALPREPSTRSPGE